MTIQALTLIGQNFSKNFTDEGSVCIFLSMLHTNLFSCLVDMSVWKPKVSVQARDLKKGVKLGRSHTVGPIGTIMVLSFL